jgi:hypothetical protein
MPSWKFVAILLAAIVSQYVVAALGWGLLLAVAGPNGVAVKTPATTDEIWFEALVAAAPDGPRAMQGLVTGCMGPARVRADDALISYPKAYPTARRRDGRFEVEWIDAPRYGVLRKTGPDAWTLTWFPASAVRTTPRRFEDDDVEFDAAAGVSAPRPTDEWLRSLGLAKALTWTPGPR